MEKYLQPSDAHERMKSEAPDSWCRGRDRLQTEQVALARLARSIASEHAELAVIRLGIAVDVGARVPEEAWAFCHEAALASPDRGLIKLYAIAWRRHVARTQVGQCTARLSGDKAFGE